MKKIKNIIVAIDFSVTSRNVYCYAKALAKKLNASLTLVHVKEDLMVVSDVMILPNPSENNTQILNDLKEIISEEEGFVFNKLARKQEIKVKLLRGNPESVLIELSKSEEADLIVMGATGSSDMLTKIFGSTSHAVSNQSHCPVILVPRTVKWVPIEQMVFASNFDSLTPESVNHITDFALSVSTNIHFVNVKSFDPVFEIKQKEVDWNILMTNHSDLYFEKHTIYGNDIVEQLKLYSEEKNIDMICVVSKHRNFWQNLVHKSITESIALSITIPIMVMHLDD